jgi:hypothetical protein
MKQFRVFPLQMAITTNYRFKRDLKGILSATRPVPSEPTEFRGPANFCSSVERFDLQNGAAVVAADP